MPRDVDDGSRTVVVTPETHDKNTTAMPHSKLHRPDGGSGFVHAALSVFKSRGSSGPSSIEHERKRLRLLRTLRLLDTGREPYLDALIASAAAIANTPVAAISLIDADRQWFKGSRGLDVCETALDVSFCRHTIQNNVAMVVPDARLDPRFANNALVTGEMHIQFYAGFPLLVDGRGVGALCVIDDHPRRLSSRQVERLTALAAGTVAWIEQHASRVAHHE